MGHKSGKSSKGGSTQMSSGKGSKKRKKLIGDVKSKPVSPTKTLSGKGGISGSVKKKGKGFTSAN